MSSRLCPFCMRMTENEICPHCGKNINYAGSPAHLPAGYVVSGTHPYVLGAALGQGGFGITYIALDMETSKRVAIKEYYPTYCSTRSDSSTVTAYSNQEEVYQKGKERFLDEARTLKSLSDLKSIVNVLDFFEANNSAYLVMEFLEGSSLKEYAAKHGKFPAQQFLNQIKPLMEDLEKMHQRGVIHRDIAPDNIILQPDGQMKLIDFGAARSYVGDKSMTVVVKKGFAPVEQYMSKGSSASTDVYALAATIYYCITGKVPPDSAERQYDDVSLASPVSLGIDITPEQDKALLQALEIQQKNRTQNIQIFLEQLHTKKKPSEPTPTPPKKKLWIVVSAIAAVLALCLGFLLFSQRDDAPAPPAESKPSMQVPVTDPTASSVLPDESPVFEEPMTDEERAAAAEAEIRYALSLLLDRNYICNEIGGAGQIPASSFVPMGMTDADGAQFYENAGHSQEHIGYINVSDRSFEANYAKGYEILCKYYKVDENGKFTNFPALTYLYNNSTGHQVIGEYIQSALAVVGITVTLEGQEWNSFLQTRRQGDFTLARNGWLADYNDPITFLDMWISSSGNNDVQFGRGTHKDLAVYDLDLTDLGYNIKVENGTWAETYDVLISLIKGCRDTETRYRLMHTAEDLLMSTGAIMPLYFYTDVYLLDSRVDGVLITPLGLKNFSKATVDGNSKSISACLSSIPETMDPALNSSMDVMSLLSHLFSGLAKWDTDENGNCVIVPDCAVELPEGVPNADGTVTYTYTLKNNMQWTSGANVTAADFEYAWKRAASIDLGADYGYLFDIIKGYPNNLAVEALDNHTLRVTLNNDVPYWNELLAFPVYFPVHEASVKDGWLDQSPTMLANGAYTIHSFATGRTEQKNHITLRKNYNYHDADEVIMEEIEFYLSDDATKMYDAFTSGILQFADDVPYGTMIESDEYHITGIMGTYYACWNINEKLLPVS